jgi:hypothetical protein
MHPALRINLGRRDVEPLQCHAFGSQCNLLQLRTTRKIRPLKAEITGSSSVCATNSSSRASNTDSLMTPRPPTTGRRKLLPVLVGICVVVLMVLALRAQGRMFLCACGEFRIWVGDICSSSNSQQLFDPYSLTHIFHGFLLFWLVALLFRNLSLAWQISLAMALEAAWEVLENTNFIIDRYRAQTAALGYTGDTVVNSLGDLFCAFVGVLVAQRIGWLRTLTLFVVLELVLVLWIRDSLLLQILMLIRPVETIKLWQLCR